MDEETRESLRIVIEYLWDDEQKNWEAEGEPSSHIFPHLQRLQRWLIEI